mmetsp:Transcript_6164/g.8968  ORF Transcript_6164/g.8968 Transcript_6164/m.8968 type:complete len:325 (-) Transcript_6164:56-1030(-)
MAKSRSTSFAINPAKTQDPTKFNKYLLQGENIVYASEIVKRRHFSSKRRVLILTNSPRLFYVCEQSKDVKGFINWTPDIRVERRRDKVKGHYFDLVTSNRVYNLEVDSQRVIDEWIKCIDIVKLGLKNKEKRHSAHEDNEDKEEKQQLHIIDMPETRNIDIVPQLNFEEKKPFGLALIRFPFEGRHKNEMSVKTGDFIFFRVMDDGDAVGSQFYPLNEINSNLGQPAYFSWEILWFEHFEGVKIPLIVDYKSNVEGIPSMNAGTYIHVYYIDINMAKCFFWLNGKLATLPAKYIIKGKLNLTTLETDNFKTIEHFISFTQPIFQ